MSIDIKAVYGDSHEIAGGLEVVRDDLESGFEVTRHHYILREAQVHITGMYAAAIELQAENAALRAKVVELEAGREWLPLQWIKDDDCMYLDESAIGVSGDDCFIRVCDDDVSLELHWCGVYQGEYYSWAEAKEKANLIYQEFLSERIFKQSEQKGAAK